jgi:hypothetical protein
MAKAKPALSLSDIALNLISIVLAFASASFAGYMVLYGPPGIQENSAAARVDLELFDPSSTQPAGSNSFDPIVTGSLAGASGDGRSENRALWEFLEQGRLVQYKLREIRAGTAFVDVSNGASSATFAVERGAMLPGVGPVLRFERRKGIWVIVTPSTEITQDGMSSLP